MKKISTNVLLACFLIILTGFFINASAAVPETISYQGYLTDSSDVPIEATVSITFKIYAQATDGIELWSETKNVAVEQGKFSVELGVDTPFDVSLFDTLLYLGIQIGSDEEMAPRKPLTSAPFALNAANAELLDGSSLEDITNGGYADADAVAAMGNLQNGNPLNHNQYTNAQAVTSMGATSDSNTLNHGRYTDDEAIASMGVEQFTNPLNHQRYSGSEAVAAMGASANTNDLRHGRYQDAEAVDALLANGGPGSGLDADQLDGQHASDIIMAASDEVRIPISSLPFDINSGGSYFLTQNLISSEGGININADNVTIDLMGFTLVGRLFTLNGFTTADDYGIYNNGNSNIVIRNGVISRWGRSAIYVQSGSDVTIENVNLIGNGFSGVGFADRAAIYLFLSVNNSHITRNTISSNAGNGIIAGSNSIVANNIVAANGAGGISMENNNSIAGNVVRNNSGISIAADGDNSVRDNVIDSIQAGAIRVEGGSMVKGNTIVFAGGYGIYSGGRSGTISHNSLTGTFLSTSTGLPTYGIYLPAVVGTGDKLLNNNSVYMFRGQVGILIEATSNELRENRVSAQQTTDCFRFSSSGADNVMIENTATGCDTGFAGTTPPASRMIGNISW